MTGFSSQTTTVVWREWSGLQDYIHGCRNRSVGCWTDIWPYYTIMMQLKYYKQGNRMIFGGRNSPLSGCHFQNY